MVSGGFREAGPEGVALQKKLEAVAHQYGIRFLGPNCLGVANPHLKLNSTMITPEGPPGFVGMASQSGSFIHQMFDYLHRHGMGFSAAMSVGNEANIDIVDCLEYLAPVLMRRSSHCILKGYPGEKVHRNGESHHTAQAHCGSLCGWSDAGRQAGLSHTGSLSGPNEIYDGMFRQCGILRAQTLSEMFDYALALGTLPRPEETG